MDPIGTVVAPSIGRELVTSRVIDAPRERVFEAFRDPERLARWWGPKGFTNRFELFEPWIGGRWRYVMRGPGGGEYPNESRFEELGWPEQITIRHVSGPPFLLFVTLVDAGSRTRLTWRQVFESAEMCDRVRGIAVPANEENLDRLEAELRRRA